MIRDITIGQYYPAKSPIHRMDPRTKLFGTLIFIISVFLFHSVAGYAVATLFLAGMIIISQVPVKFIFKGLKAIFMILMITMVFNILLTPHAAVPGLLEEGAELVGGQRFHLLVFDFWQGAALCRIAGYQLLLDGEIVRRADHLVDVADGLWC